MGLDGVQRAIPPAVKMLQRFVLEAVEALATPDVTQRIIDDALLRADHTDIPHQPRELSRFVEEHLHNAISESLGEEAAELVRSRLAPMIRRHTDPSEISYVRVRKQSGQDLEAVPSNRPSQPVTLPESDERAKSAPVARALPESGVSRETRRPEETPLPTVLIAAEVSDRRDRLVDELEGDAVVQQVEDVMAFIDHMRGNHVGAPLVVIDCDTPTVQPTTVATLAPDFPQGTVVVLWGADETLEEDVKRLARAEAASSAVRPPPARTTSRCSRSHCSGLEDAAAGAASIMRARTSASSSSDGPSPARSSPLRSQGHSGPQSRHPTSRSIGAQRTRT